MLKSIVLLSCLLTFCSSSSGQTGIALNHPFFFQSNTKKEIFFYKKSIKSSKSVHNNPKKITQPMPKAYCYRELAFFCKIEVQLEKHSSLPVKFRLGSVPYADYLEQK